MRRSATVPRDQVVTAWLVAIPVLLLLAALAAAVGPSVRSDAASWGSAERFNVRSLMPAVVEATKSKDLRQRDNVCAQLLPAVEAAPDEIAIASGDWCAAPTARLAAAAGALYSAIDLDDSPTRSLK